MNTPRTLHILLTRQGRNRKIKVARLDIRQFGRAQQSQGDIEDGDGGMDVIIESDRKDVETRDRVGAGVIGDSGDS